MTSTAVHVPTIVGLESARYLMTVANGKNVSSRIGFAEGKDWPRTAAAVRQGFIGTKASVNPMSAFGPGGGSELVNTPLGAVQADFSEFLRPMTLLGRLTGTLSLPFNVRMISASTGLTAAWVRPGQPIPVSSLTLTQAGLVPRRVAVIAAVTQELARSASPDAPAVLLREVARAVAYRMDLSMFDPGAGSADEPVSLANGATSFASQGSTLAQIDADLKLLIDAATIANANLATSFWIMHQSTASYLALLRGTGGAPAFPFIGPRGGTLLGVPVLTTSAFTSENSPAERYIALVDASGIAVADDGASELDTSSETSLVMDSTPSSPAEMVSLFQHDLLAFRAVRFANWTRRNSGAVTMLTDVYF